MRIIGLLLALALSACAAGAQLGAQAVNDPSGAAANLFGIPAATIAKQMSAELAEIQMVAAQLQMLKAQLDGTLPVLQVPPVVQPVISTPVITTPMPDGPIVTPNIAAPQWHRHRVSYRRPAIVDEHPQQFIDFFGEHPPSFRLTSDLGAEPIGKE